MRSKKIGICLVCGLLALPSACSNSSDPRSDTSPSGKPGSGGSNSAGNGNPSAGVVESGAGASGSDAGASGGPGAGGSGGALSAGAGQTGAGGSGFTLAWQDDFSSLDAAAWQLQTFSFDGNQAQFATENASVANGILTIALTLAPSGAAKPYLGVEMRSTKTLTYGKVSTRMRFAKGSGVVSGLVLFYTPYPNCDWNEIDIEHLGKSGTVSQLNAQVFSGAPSPACTTSVTPTQEPLLANLGFDAEADFHLYDIEWTPAAVRYFADGALLRTWNTHIDRLELPQNILLTIWASSAASWAGPLSESSAPTSADIDWIKVYDYSP